MKIKLVVLLVLTCVTSTQSAALRKKTSTRVEDLLTLLRRWYEQGTELCLGEGNSYHQKGESFSLFDGCYNCSFNESCDLSCHPNPECHDKIEWCEYEGEQYPMFVNQDELTDDPLCSCKFVYSCTKSCMCARK